MSSSVFWFWAEITSIPPGIIHTTGGPFCDHTVEAGSTILIIMGAQRAAATVTPTLRTCHCHSTVGGWCCSHGNTCVADLCNVPQNSRRTHRGIAAATRAPARLGTVAAPAVALPQPARCDVFVGQP